LVCSSPYLDLAVLRIVAVSMQLFWTIVYADLFGAVQQVAALPSEYWDPPILLNLINLLLGWGFRPSFEFLNLLYSLSLIAGFPCFDRQFGESGSVCICSDKCLLAGFFVFFWRLSSSRGCDDGGPRGVGA
jgi:hypothetical protein